jgi:hypothetical protein
VPLYSNLLHACTRSHAQAGRVDPDQQRTDQYVP